jgi:serine phosphatase RsbU (regulator of sigma subunit)
VAAVEEVNEGLSLNALATLIVATLRPGPQGWELAWVNAGHHPPLVVTPDGQMRLLDTTPDLLVGVTVAARRTHRQLLEAGSTLLLYTDGLIERRAKTSERLHAKLRLTVSHFLSAPLDELCSQVITEAASGPLEDDVALLALRVTASTPASTS